MYSYKLGDINFGFIILSPDHNIGRLKTTAYSIKTKYRNAKYICATSDSATSDDLKEMQEICPVHKGKNTYTSLINTGMGNGHPEWNIIVMEGSVVPYNTDRKLFQFLEDKKDIFFPIIADYGYNGKPSKIYSTFVESTLNGLTIHRDTFLEVGNLEEEVSEDDSLSTSKTKWGFDAVQIGCRFKAILGTKIC